MVCKLFFGRLSSAVAGLLFYTDEQGMRVIGKLVLECRSMLKRMQRDNTVIIYMRWPSECKIAEK